MRDSVLVINTVIFVDAGAIVFADAIAAGQLDQLQELSLRNNGLGNASAIALSASLRARPAHLLQQLILDTNESYQKKFAAQVLVLCYLSDDLSSIFSSLLRLLCVDDIILCDSNLDPKSLVQPNRRNPLRRGPFTAQSEDAEHIQVGPRYHD